MNRTIYAKASQNILKEIPRFFGGFSSALSEIMQNAYRAGAQNVTVIHDEENHILTISDDGTGLDDPQKVLTAGESSWNNKKIVDPAGLGAFAILSDEFIEGVEYQSLGAGNWSMKLTSEVLEGGPIEVTDMDNSEGRTGMTIILQLNKNQEVQESMIQNARELYPFKLTMQDRNGSREILAKKLWEPTIVLKTTVGTVEVKLRTGHDGGAAVIWEYRAIGSKAFTNALAKAVNKSTHPLIAASLFNNINGSARSFSWIVDPASGVRPKLPDRNELVDDRSLGKAAEVIVNMLTNVVFTEAQEASQKWPDKISADELKVLASKTEWLNTMMTVECHKDVREAILKELGWKRIQYSCTDDFDTAIENGDNGDSLVINEYELDSYHKKPKFIVGSESLAHTLNNLGHPTFVEKGAPNPKVTVTGLRLSGVSKWIALADKIEIEGWGPIPFLLTRAEWDIDDLANVIGNQALEGGKRLAVVFAGTPAECVRAVHEIADIRNQVILNQYVTNWDRSWEDGEEVNWTKVENDIELQVIKAFVPEIADKRAYMHRLGEYKDAVDEALMSINSLTYQITYGDILSDPELTVRQELDHLQNIVSIITGRLNTKMGKLQSETDLSL